MRDTKYMVLGAVIGVLLVAYVLMYIPMKANYAECEKITLCETVRR